jgi:L-lactate utilization protein LutB
LLTKDEYLATFVEPMRRLEADESYKPVRIGEYVAEFIAAFDPPVTKGQLQIHHVYLNGDRTFYHVLIDFGRHNEFLIIVVDCIRKAVWGHYLLDLNREYGLAGSDA